MARRFKSRESSPNLSLSIKISEKFTDLLYFVEVQFQPKKKFYRRFFAEILVYLEQYEPANDWLAVAIFASRSLKPEFSAQYRHLRPALRVIYLDEIAGADDLPISLDIVKLVVMAPEPEQVRGELPSLWEKLPRQISDPVQEREIFNFIETILLYKFPRFSREEIEDMFGLSDLRETEVYREAKAEGKLEGELLGKLKTVPRFLALGLGVEQIAEELDLDVQLVLQVAAGKDSSN